MKQLIIFVILLSLPVQTDAQLDTESSIKEIRRLFYGLKTDELEKDSTRDITYFSQNDELKKVVVDFYEERTEYFFDSGYNSEGAYFIYSFERGDNENIEHRYYYDQSGQLIRLLGPTKEMMSLKENCLTGMVLQAQSVDLNNGFNNEVITEKDPNQKLVEDIMNDVITIGKLKLYPDTLLDYFNDEEAYFESEIKYFDEGGNLWKWESMQGGDHSVETETKFFEPYGSVVAIKLESGTVFGQSSTTWSYFNSDAEIIRQTIQKSVFPSGYDNEDCLGFEHSYFPVIISK